MHEYLRRIAIAGELNLLPIARSEVADVEVLHDDWCAVYQQKECNCDPVIKCKGKEIKPEGGWHAK